MSFIDVSVLIIAIIVSTSGALSTLPASTLAPRIESTSATVETKMSVSSSAGDVITTIAGSSTVPSFSGDNGAATSATLCNPSGIALDSSGTPAYP